MRLTDGVLTVSLTASYLSDALTDLVEAVTATIEGAASARCSWAEEPGEYRWVFKAAGARVTTQILWFDDDELWAQQPDDQGRIVCTIEQSKAELGQAVIDCADGLVARMSEKGYAKEWQVAPFPADALRALSRAVSALE